MKYKFFDLIIIISFTLLLYLILIYNNLVFDSVSYSLNIWVNNLIPSMFPFFVISDILISYNIVSYIPKTINNIFSYIFNISDVGVTIFFLSLISGFPSSARNIKNYYLRGFLSLEEANHLLLFTHFSNPMFILSTVGIIFLNNNYYGYIILISHYMGNFIIGIFLRNKTTIAIKNYTKVKPVCQNFSRVLISSIKTSIDTLLLILGTLTSFLIVSTFITYLFDFSLYSSSIIKGILEMTMGIKEISLLNISNIYKIVISTMFISFGGFSVHMQIISQIVDTDINYNRFLIARIYHAITSGLISCLLFMIL